MLIPVATLGFLRSGRFSHGCALGLTLGGLLGTLCAFPLVNLIAEHLTLMRWLVIVVIITGFSFEEREWPHGWKGTANPHGVVFSR